ncbi:MAG: hypothetical protein RLZZ251_433 [Actinomycetota bacterium]
MQNEIIDWYRANKRDLPWRSTSPWGVVVSEFMLQQTPVSRVLPVWNSWMKRWPFSASLASATKADVIRAWGNLGYPRRAIRLHETSKILVAKYGGDIPQDINSLRELPGIGEYTAAAIFAFAFQERSLVLDTNIRRLFARVLDGTSTYPAHITAKERTSREKLIPESASTWAAATMELGALVCTAKNPNCEQCPLSDICRWRAAGYPESKVSKRSPGWHGTNRQCRGVILKTLRENHYSSGISLKKLWPDTSQLEICLQSLIDDGFIEEHEKKYCLAK